MPAMTATPSPSESGDITTALLCLFNDELSWNSVMLDFSE